MASQKIHVNINNLQSALMDMYDVRNALSKRIKNKPKEEFSMISIGDCIDDVIHTLEQIEAEAIHE